MQVQIWDLQTLQCQHVLKVPGREVVSLVAMKGEVWGGVSGVRSEIVLWGRE